jgi:hypothetical protein
VEVIADAFRYQQQVAVAAAIFSLTFGLFGLLGHSDHNFRVLR